MCLSVSLRMITSVLREVDVFKVKQKGGEHKFIIDLLDFAEGVKIFVVVGLER